MVNFYKQNNVIYLPITIDQYLKLIFSRRREDRSKFFYSLRSINSFFFFRAESARLQLTDTLSIIHTHDHFSARRPCRQRHSAKRLYLSGKVELAFNRLLDCRELVIVNGGTEFISAVIKRASISFIEATESRQRRVRRAEIKAPLHAGISRWQM